jgi:hypothetical protein
MTPLYVFALSGEKGKPFRAAGHRIEFVEAHGVYAAVERVAGRPEVSEAALRAQHDIVARIAERVDAVLPARFGSLVDEVELGRVTAASQKAIRDALDLVRGRAQMTIRVFDSAAPADAEPVRAGAPATTGTAYLADRRRAAGARPLPPRAAAIAEAVAGLVAAQRTEGAHGRVAAALYHLVDRPRVAAYREALERLQSRQLTGTMTVSGPWPPFAFVPDLWP